jgi:hypothetical protein
MPIPSAVAPVSAVPAHHITKDRGAFTHDDDRVDAVAGAVAHFQRAMMIDIDQTAKAIARGADAGRDRGFSSKASTSPPTAACGSMSSGLLPGHPRSVVGDSRPEAEWIIQ